MRVTWLRAKDSGVNRRVAIVSAALLVCAGMWLYAPFRDPALVDEGPAYSLTWRAPASLNAGGMTVDWTVLTAEWLGVILLAAISILVGDNWTRRSAALRTVWIAAALAALRTLFFPPMIGGGPLGLHVGRDWLFHHGRETEIWVGRADDEMLVIFIVGLATHVAIILWNRASTRRLARAHLENA
jgi:hypothetical protein